jgi:outer membrane protein assembly factor BamB
VLLLGLPSSLAADDAPSGPGWHQFRGPRRDGRSSETGLKRAWPLSGPRELWRVPIGVGFSGISIVGDRLYTMDADEGEEYAVCLAADDGRPLWRTPVGLVFEDVNGNGPRSAPTVQGGLAFVIGSRGRLAALESTTGQVVWQVELAEAFGSELPTWGFSSAPLIEGEELVVEVGGTGAQAIAAFGKNSGELRWTSVEANPAYSSPIGVDIGGSRQLVFLTQQKLLALSTEGEELWSVPFAPKVDIKPAQPVFVAPDLILVSASYGVGAKVVRLKVEAGTVAAEEVWSGQQMRNHFNASVALDGHVYGFDAATLRCINARTGERRWAKRGLGKGSLIAADGLLLVLSERGKLVLVEATPEAYQELAAHQVLRGRCWTPPSLWEGRLYLRHHSELVCLDLKG